VSAHRKARNVLSHDGQVLLAALLNKNTPQERIAEIFGVAQATVSRWAARYLTRQFTLKPADTEPGQEKAS
jgi:predicted transcriptional regulator